MYIYPHFFATGKRFDFLSKLFLQFVHLHDTNTRHKYTTQIHDTNTRHKYTI